MQTAIKDAKSSNRGKIVNTNHVNQLIRNYKTKRWIANSKQLGKVDSLSTWYGLTELQDFLDFARANKADGIKMYFGVYPDDFEISDFRGRQTVVIVATKTKQTEQGVLNKNLYYHVDGRTEILAFNLGQIYPPWCAPPPPPGEGGYFGIEMEKIGISIVDDGNKLLIV